MAVFDIEAELAAILSAFEQEDFEYAICGGIALAVHGHPRATTDIDVLVDSDSMQRITEALRGIGYALRAAPMRFSSGVEVHRISRIEAGELFTIDLLPVTEIFEGIWNQRHKVSWQGRPLWVVSRNGLAKMKQIAGRKQDLADLEMMGFEDE